MLLVNNVIKYKNFLGRDPTPVLFSDGLNTRPCKILDPPLLSWPCQGEYARVGLQPVLDSPSYSFHVPSHFLRLLQFSADYHVIWISVSVIHLSAETLMNTANRPYTVPRDVQNQKGFQLLGQGLCPWTPLGAQPPDPRYSLALPRSPCPPLKFVLASLGLRFWRRRWPRGSDRELADKDAVIWGFVEL